MGLIAAWKGLWGITPPKEIQYINNKFTDEDREKSAASKSLAAAELRRKNETAQIKHDIEMADLRQQLADLREAGKGDDSDIDKIMMAFLMQKMGGQATPQGSPAPTPGDDAVDAYISLPDEKIREVIAKFPKDKVDMFRLLPAQLQRSKAEQFFPEVDDDTIDRAMVIINGN